MKRALFMTVGTGVGLDKEKKIRSLAHGLLASILMFLRQNFFRKVYLRL
jgi:hypothetical protein